MGEIAAAEELKPFLLHEDRHVRGAVAGYFAQGWSADPSIVELVLDACERYGEVENLTALSICRTLRQTPRSFARMLDRLSAVADDEVARSAVLDVIERVPWSAAQVVAEERGGLPDLGENFARRMEWCAEFAALSADELWQALSDYAQACDDLRSSEEADFDYSEDLVEALAARGAPDETVLLEALGGGGTSFAELFAVQLAGARRMSAAIPALIETYRGDVEVLAQEATDAMARIGDPRAVGLARQAFAAESARFREYAAGLFEALKHPESEDAAYTLLAAESDPVVRSLLCEALCMLFSRRGFAAACAELESGARTEELSFVLIPASVVLGLDLPVAARLWWELEKVRPALVPEPQADAETVRRPPKIGRNDPCPCGSGKKYKKCCGC